MLKSNINNVIEKEKLLIMTRFLKNAPFDGWNNNNLYNSVKESGFDPSYADLLFQEKIRDFTKYFYTYLDKKMSEEFKQKSLDNLSISEKIAFLIELKFSLYYPNKLAISKLLQYNMLPQNFIFAQQSLWQTCDEIWYLAGDRSTDFNYYSKRGILAYVYSGSLLYFLSDESKDFFETKVFIRKKIQEVLSIGKLKKSGKVFFKNLFSKAS